MVYLIDPPPWHSERFSAMIRNHLVNSPLAYFSPRLYAVYEAMRWSGHPSKPALQIQNPGVIISQKIPLRKSPL
jgi:hypothetical protein